MAWHVLVAQRVEKRAYRFWSLHPSQMHRHGLWHRDGHEPNHERAGAPCEKFARPVVSPPGGPFANRFYVENWLRILEDV